MRHQRRQQEHGFTLIELVLATTVLTIIMASITTALVAYLQNGRETMERDDHSAGASLLSTYLDRDAASADTFTVSATTSCSGVANKALLSWSEWSASPTAPDPVAGTTYSSAYAVTADPSSVPAGGGVRYRLVRTHCRGGTVLSTTTLVPNLLSAASVAVSLPTDTSCASGSAVAVVLTPYGADSSQPYTFRSCTKSRL